MVAYDALQKIRANPKNTDARMVFDKTWPDLGYALLVKRYQSDMSKVTEEDIKKAAIDTVPNVAPLFWAFRVMVAVGMYLILFFGVAFWLASRGRLDSRRGLLKVALWSLPLPWVAIESGWFVSSTAASPGDRRRAADLLRGLRPDHHGPGHQPGDFPGAVVLLIIGVKVMLHAIKAGPKSDGPARAGAAADPVRAAVRA